MLRARASISDPRAMALGLQLLRIRSEQGDRAAVSALIAQHGLAPDLCSVAVPPVRYNGSNITPEDYPTDVIQTLGQGRTTLEFGIDAAGAATGVRTLVSDPPYAFDAIALTKAATITYEPSRLDGVARPCKARVQSVTWRLPY